MDESKVGEDTANCKEGVNNCNKGHSNSRGQTWFTLKTHLCSLYLPAALCSMDTEILYKKSIKRFKNQNGILSKSPAF